MLTLRMHSDRSLVGRILMKNTFPVCKPGNNPHNAHIENIYLDGGNLII